jgi:hypothetical protein
MASLFAYDFHFFTEYNPSGHQSSAILLRAIVPVPCRAGPTCKPSRARPAGSSSNVERNGANGGSMAKKRPDGIRDYHHPAGGWGALRAVAAALKRQQVVPEGIGTLLKNNQPDGFDCPGCAWPDPKHTSAFEFCENGAKAVTWESTAKRVDPDFFAGNSVASLWMRSDHWLENQGRLTHPLRYNPGPITSRSSAGMKR